MSRLKYPPKQEWDGDLRNLIFMEAEHAPEDWIDDWRVSVGLISAEESDYVFRDEEREKSEDKKTVSNDQRTRKRR